jgi:CheY-like chemotaxis protein
VDDAEFFRTLYSAALTDAGFEVASAQNGEEAVAKMKSFMPRLVFLDFVMPESTGGDALVKIKKDADIQNIPVVMLTSISADVKGEDLLLLGAVAYLEKDSVTPEDVVNKAKEILGTSEAPLDPRKA